MEIIAQFDKGLNVTKKVFASKSSSIVQTEKNFGWTHMKACIRNVMLVARTQAILDEILRLFEQQLTSLLSDASVIEEMHEVMAIIRLSGMYMVDNQQQFIWLHNIQTTGPHAQLNLLSFKAEVIEGSLCISWRICDSEFQLEPTVHIIQRSKSNFLRSKSWTEIQTIPRATTHEDVQNLLQIIESMNKFSQ